MTVQLNNPLAERLRRGDLGLALMVRHARTVDIALAAKVCGFDALYFDLQHSPLPEYEVAQMWCGGRWAWASRRWCAFRKRLRHGAARA
jgi:2-keto-3-deoxy-L-rhamnonate aldolase RhmA